MSWMRVKALIAPIGSRVNGMTSKTDWIESFNAMDEDAGIDAILDALFG